MYKKNEVIKYVEMEASVVKISIINLRAMYNSMIFSNKNNQLHDFV